LRELALQLQEQIKSPLRRYFESATIVVESAEAPRFLPEDNWDDEKQKQLIELYDRTLASLRQGSQQASKAADEPSGDGQPPAGSSSG
jgi:hypothetical protein